jgi:hypothetical protein
LSSNLIVRHLPSSLPSTKSKCPLITLDGFIDSLSHAEPNSMKFADNGRQ